MKKLIIPLLLATVLLGGCHRVTVRHQAHLPPAVEVVEHRHVHNSEVVVHRHQGGQPPGHRHKYYSHQGPDRVVVVRPQAVVQTRVYSRPHSGHVAPPPHRRTYGYGNAPLPRVTERIIRHRVDNPPVHRETSRVRLNSDSPQERYRHRRAARDNSAYDHGDSRRGEENRNRGGNGGNNGNYGRENNGRDDVDRADRRKPQRGPGSQKVANNKGKKDGDKVSKMDKERQRGEEKERGWGRGGH